MNRRELLREQADILWRLAESSEIEVIRREMRHLATVCEGQISDLTKQSEQQRVSPSRSS